MNVIGQFLGVMLLVAALGPAMGMVAIVLLVIAAIAIPIVCTAMAIYMASLIFNYLTEKR
jgi:hypothetical protein